MCFGGGNTETRTVVQQSKNEIPAYIEQGSQEVLSNAKPLSERQYPQYQENRIAGFAPDQLEAFNLARGSVGVYQDDLNRARASNAYAQAPATSEDISRYMNPFTQKVIDTTVSELNRQHNRDVGAMHDSMAGRGSYLNEDRRGVMENLARESRDRVIGETVARLQGAAFSDALDQTNSERNRMMQGAAVSSNIAPTAQSLAFGDVGSMMDIGGRQQNIEQQKLSLDYEDFLRQFYYPQEQQNWMMSLVQGAPYSTTQQTSGDQIIPTANAFAQSLGGAGAFLGGAGALAESGGFKNLFNLFD